MHQQYQARSIAQTPTGSMKSNTSHLLNTLAFIVKVILCSYFFQKWSHDSELRSCSNSRSFKINHSNNKILVFATKKELILVLRLKSSLEIID
jgi:hypothetical protein